MRVGRRPRLGTRQAERRGRQLYPAARGARLWRRGLVDGDKPELPQHGAARRVLQEVRPFNILEPKHIKAVGDDSSGRLGRVAAAPECAPEPVADARRLVKVVAVEADAADQFVVVALDDRQRQARAGLG